jgi:hypothetical protein
MRLRRTNPCAECPFKCDSPAGVMGGWTPQTIVQQAHSEYGLACHMDAEKKRHLNDADLIEKVHVCVGSLQNANLSAKSYRNPQLRVWADKVGTGTGILRLIEFFEHHVNGMFSKKVYKE